MDKPKFTADHVDKAQTIIEVLEHAQNLRTKKAIEDLLQWQEMAENPEILQAISVIYADITAKIEAATKKFQENNQQQKNGKL